MDGKQVVKLAADLAAGSISASYIKEYYGEGVLSSVLAIAGGSMAGVAVDTALDILDRETGIVSDLGSLVDDVVDTFKFW